jgi:hypothetical protein
MGPVDNTIEIGEAERRKMVEEVNSCTIYLIYCKNLCKCHNVPPPMATIKEKGNQIFLFEKPCLSLYYLIPIPPSGHH